MSRHTLRIYRNNLRYICRILYMQYSQQYCCLVFLICVGFAKFRMHGTANKKIMSNRYKPFINHHQTIVKIANSACLQYPQMLTQRVGKLNITDMSNYTYNIYAEWSETIHPSCHSKFVIRKNYFCPGASVTVKPVLCKGCTCTIHAFLMTAYQGQPFISWEPGRKA